MKNILTLIVFVLVMTACLPNTATSARVTPSPQVVKETVIAPVTVQVPVTVVVSAMPAPAPTRLPTLTNTPVPTLTMPFPTPTRIVKSVNGVVGLTFNLEKTTVRVNEDIWFNFAVKNTNSFDVAYAGIGAVINDRKSQPSWGDATLGAGATLEWRDHINYGVPGKYRIYLGYCWLRWRYECERAIDGNGWGWLSDPIDLEITP